MVRGSAVDSTSDQVAVLDDLALYTGSFGSKCWSVPSFDFHWCLAATGLLLDDIERNVSSLSPWLLGTRPYSMKFDSGQ